MDWTGGTRRRFAAKGRGNAVVRKQRAHFAKVRAGEHPTLTGGMREASASKLHGPLMIGLNDIHDQENIQGSSIGHVSGVARSQAGDRRMATPRRLRSPASRPPGFASGRMAAITQTQRAGIGLEEESRQMSTRQQLLARSDWLGLEITKPVEMKFPSHGEKERIGKRRKIEKHHKSRTIPADKPIFAHVGGDLLPLYEPSAAFLTDDIRIRVGTDAFASQTQKSRRFSTPVQTSLAPPSTAVSEESMLLHANSDGFEAQVEGQAGVVRHQSQATRHWKHPPVECDILLPYAEQAGAEQDQPESSEASIDSLADREPSSPAQPTMDETLSVEERWPVLHRESSAGSAMLDDGQDAARSTVAVPSKTVPQEVMSMEAEHEVQQEDEVASEADDDDDEFMWKQIMHIKQTESSNASMAAVRSSSPHLTQPTEFPSTEQEPLNEVVVERDQDNRTDRQLESTDNEANAEQALRERLPEHLHVSYVNEEDSASEEDALWRKFVLGSKSTQEDSSLAGRNRQPASDTESMSPLLKSTSAPNIQDLRSDRATVDGSEYAVETQEDIISQSHPTDSSSEEQTNTSMIGHATTTGPRTEDIEDDDDVQPPRRDPRPGRPLRSKLDPRRFKQSRKRAPYPPLPRVVPRFLPTISTANTPATRSPYDLSSGSLSF